MRLLLLLLPYARRAEDLQNRRDSANAAKWVENMGHRPEAVLFVSISSNQAGVLLGTTGKAARYHLRSLQERGLLVKIAEPTGTRSALYALAVPDNARGSVSPNNTYPLDNPEGVSTEPLGGKYEGARGSVSPNNAYPTINNQIFTKDEASETRPGNPGGPVRLSVAASNILRRIAAERCPECLPEGGENT